MLLSATGVPGQQNIGEDVEVMRALDQRPAGAG
jgi:hypothetical protein